MTIAAKRTAPENSSESIRKVAELVGRARILSRRVVSALDAHELLLRGLPAHALDHLVARLTVLGKTDSLEKAVGMSVRTRQRLTSC